MGGKIEKDLGGAAEILLDLFGGPGASDAIKDAMNLGKAATAGIPKRDPCAEENDDPDPVPTKRETRGEARKKEESGVIDMTTCEGCGTFFVGEACGSCGMSVPVPEATTSPGKKAPAGEALYYCVFSMGGAYHSKFVSPYQACDQSRQIRGYVRVLAQSELKGR